MNLIKYILQYFLLLRFVCFSYEKVVKINDFESFENELKQYENDDIIDLIITNNITISHEIEIQYDNNIRINISGSDSNIYINQGLQIDNERKIKDYNDTRIFNGFMIKITGAIEINIYDIIINGNINFENINNLKFDNIITTGDIHLYQCELLIKNSLFNTNNRITDSLILNLNNTNGDIENSVFNTSTKVELVILAQNCEINIKNTTLNGSFDKFEKTPDDHGALKFIESEVKMDRVEITNFGDLNSRG